MGVGELLSPTMVKLRYGFRVNASSVEDLLGQEEEGVRLRKLYRRILTRLGFNKTVKSG